MRIRPGRRSHPRSRLRPKHSQASPAMVIAVDRGRYTCQLADRRVVAMRARELGRRGVVVGDEVALVGDVSGRPDTLARIVRISERSSVLRRSGDDIDRGEGVDERIIVANVDQLVVVASLVDPPARLGLIDRCLVAAYEAGVTPIVCLTKADLDGAQAALDEVLAYYADLERAEQLRHVVCQLNAPLTELAELLTGQISVLCGHSGVGKSTLVNALVPGADRVTAAVSGVGKGRHTSTSAVALALAGGGWVVDTPGVRSFGLAHLDTEDLLHGFPDLVEASTQCEPGCTHDADEPHCGLDAWVARAKARADRLASFRSLLASHSSDHGKP